MDKLPSAERSVHLSLLTATMIAYQHPTGSRQLCTVQLGQHNVEECILKSLASEAYLSPRNPLVERTTCLRQKGCSRQYQICTYCVRPYHLLRLNAALRDSSAIGLATSRNRLSELLHMRFWRMKLLLIPDGQELRS